LKLFIQTDELLKGPRPGNTGPKLPQKAPSQPKAFSAPQQTPKPKAGPQASPKQSGPMNITSGPLKTPGSPRTASNIQYEYWKGEGAPPSGGNWESYQKKDGGMGYRRPLGSGGGGNAKQEGQESQGSAQEQQAPEMQEREPPKPEHVSDPLTHDDGSKVGEESLDNRDDGLEDDPWAEERAEASAPLSPEDQAFAEKLNSTFDKFDQANQKKEQEDLDRTAAVFDRFEQGQKKQKLKEGNKAKLSQLGNLGQKNAEREAERAAGRQEVEGILNELRPEEAKAKPEAKAAEHQKRAQEVLDNLTGRAGVPKLSPKLKEEVEDRKNPFLLTRQKDAAPIPLVNEKEADPIPLVNQKESEKPVEPKVKAEDIKAAHDRAAEVEGMAEEHSSKEEKFKSDTKKHKENISKIDKEISEKTKKIKELERHESTVQSSKRKVESLKDKVKKTAARLAEAKNFTFGGKKKAPNPDAVKKAEAAHKEATKNLEAAEKEHKANTDKHAENKKTISGLRKEISGHERDKKSAEKEHSAKEKEVSESKKNVASAQEEVAQNKNKDYKLPETDDEILDHKQHIDHAKRMVDNIESHLRDNPDDQEELQKLKKIYQEQGAIVHMPTKEDRQAMQRANSYSKNYGFSEHTDDIQVREDAKQLKAEQKQLGQEMKAAEKEAKAVEKERSKREAGIARQQKKDGIVPPSQKVAERQERAASKEHEQNNTRGSSIMSNYNSGKHAGSAVSQATISNEGGASMMGGMLDFGSRGVVSAGHALLGSDGKKKDKKDDSSKKDSSKENNVNNQRLEEAQKGMRLYLDLNKAIGPRPNVGVNSDKTPEQNKEDHDSSFEKRSAGTEAGGDPTDSPGNGRKINEVEKGDGVAKGFFTWDQTFSDMRKSLNASNTLHPLEEEFTKSVLGGKRTITGRNRGLFSEYACDKLQKSLSDLIHKV